MYISDFQKSPNKLQLVHQIFPLKDAFCPVIHSHKNKFQKNQWKSNIAMTSVSTTVSSPACFNPSEKKSGTNAEISTEIGNTLTLEMPVFSIKSLFTYQPHTVVYLQACEQSLNLLHNCFCFSFTSPMSVSTFSQLNKALHYCSKAHWQ